MKINIHERGITLLVTLLLMGVLLGVSASMMNITLKQYQLSGIAYSSEIAFQAANAGMECILYHDFPKTGGSPFDVGNNEQTIGCMNQSSAELADGNSTIASGEEQKYAFSWGTPVVCSEVSLYKYYSASANVNYTINGVNKTCPQGSTCTVVQARGYNVSCAERATSLRVVEREYTQIY